MEALSWKRQVTVRIMLGFMVALDPPIVEKDIWYYCLLVLKDRSGIPDVLSEIPPECDGLTEGLQRDSAEAILYPDLARIFAGRKGRLLG